MKKTIKKLLGILTLVVLLLTISCTEDLYKEDTFTKENLEFIIKKVNFHEISLNKKLVEKLRKLNSKKEKNKNENGKIVYSSEYNFYLDTDFATYIEDEYGNHSYTFPIIRDSTQYLLENLIIRLNTNNSYSAYLIQYNITENELDQIENGNFQGITSNKLILKPFDLNSFDDNIFAKADMVCECGLNNYLGEDGLYYVVNRTTNGVITWVQHTCSGTGGGGGGSTGSSGSSGYSGYTGSGSYNNPTGNTGSTTGSNTNDGTGTTSGGTSGTGSNNNQNPIYTTPTYPSPQQILKDKFIKQLSGGFLNPNNPKDCFNNLPQEQKDEILDYVGSFALEFVDGTTTTNTTNTAEDELFNLTEEIIMNSCSGGSVDFNNKIIIDPSFENNQKAMCVYNKMRTIDGFNKVLVPFEGENPDAFIRLKTETLPQNVRAETKEPNSSNIIDIILNDCTSCTNGINSQPNLLLAQTILHEVLHAELFRQIIVAIGNGSYIYDYDTIVNALENSQYSKLANYFRTTNDWSHNYMAEHFRRAIGRVTQQYDTGILVTSSQIPLPFYTNLAWRGLMVYEDPIIGNGVVAWMELVGNNINNPSQASIDIQNTINNYLQNNINQLCQD